MEFISKQSVTIHQGRKTTMFLHPTVSLVGRLPNALQTLIHSSSIMSMISVLNVDVSVWLKRNSYGHNSFFWRSPLCHHPICK
jgi:hypothetical protein